jgi:general secretion pathway protein G
MFESGIPPCRPAPSPARSPSPTHRRRGFTLVEVLIVVVIMAILAAIVIPTVSDGTTQSKRATVASNLQILRSQIELYKQQHNSQPPADLDVLTVKTNLAGQAGTTAEFTLGPYIREIPVNPFTGSTKVTAAASNPPAAATGAPDAGWFYHAASGGIWVDDAELLSE